MSISVYQAFRQAVDRYADREMLCIVTDTARRYGYEPASISYRDAHARVRRLIAAYRSLGLAPGSRVALGLDNRPEFFYHWLALNALRLSAVPLNPHWRSAELEYVLEHSEARLAVTLADRLQAIQAAAPPDCAALASDGGWTRAEGDGEPAASPDELSAPVQFLPQFVKSDGVPATSPGSEDECALLYTSGTTGRPKGCVLDNEYFLCSGARYRDLGGYCTLSPGEDRLITPLPMHHMNAMATSTMAMLLTGGCIVPLDRFHPRSWWESVRESGATIMHYLGVMPAILMQQSESSVDRSHRVRFGFGAGLGGELHAAFEHRFGIPLIEAWAMTETGCGVAIAAHQEPRKPGTGCIGRPPAHVGYRIVDEEDRDVATGQSGELLVRRAGARPRQGLFREYLKDPAATEAAWSGGYFHTGDLVYLDADGLLHFVDRKKNVIRRSGENISAVEIEETLIEHPAVLAAGVTAVPDEIRGDEVFACVVADGDAGPWPVAAERIVRHCLDRLAYFKAPGYMARCDELPLTATEKIQRAALKDLAEKRLAAGECIDTRALKTRYARGATPRAPRPKAPAGTD